MTGTLGAVHATLGRGATLTYRSPGLTAWHAPEREEPVWFDHGHGRITVKNPDDDVLVKLKRLAAQLGARIVGDEGETYE